MKLQSDLYLKNNSQAEKTVTREEKLAALERVLASKRFVNAPMKQRFLRLVCETHIAGRGNELNEYLLGKEVFERGDNYSPATDPIVRVSAHNVREKLNLYNQNEGANETVQIEIPIGSYEPAFFRKGNPDETKTPTVVALTHPELENQPHPILPKPAKPEPMPETSSDVQARQGNNWLLYAATLLFAALAAYQFWLNQNLHSVTKNQTRQTRENGGLAWKPFFHSQQPTLFILSNPVVHRLANDADPSMLRQKGITLSADQISVLNNATSNRLPVSSLGPRLIPAFNMYTGIGEAIGVYRLSELFHQAGESTILKQSRSISPDDLKNYDVVMLGSVYSNQWSKPLSIKENFIYSSHSTIENVAPREGEPREYKAVFDPQTGMLVEDYALITVTPSVAENRTAMVLAGIFSEGTEAAAEYITNPIQLAELNQQLGKLKPSGNGMAYYQALLRVRVENAFPTKITLVTVRELQTTP